MPAPLSWTDQSDRIRAVFGLEHDQPLPRVDIDSLLAYMDHLQALVGQGPLEAEYQESSGLGRDQVCFCGVCDAVDASSGLWCNIFGETVHGEFPLCEVTLTEESGFRETIEDYKHWFQEGKIAPR